MIKFYETIVRAQGGPFQGVQVTVYNASTLALANIYAEDGAGIITDSTVTSDVNGFFEFYASNGRYTLEFRVGGQLLKTLTDISISGTTDLDVLLGPAAITTETVGATVGGGRTGDGIAFIDLVGDTTYPDFGLRILRGAGPNAGTSLTSRGTGAFVLASNEAADIDFVTNGLTRFRVAASAYRVDIGPGLSTETATLHIGDGRVGNGISHIDLISDATYTDFGGRILRGSGPNGGLSILNRGTGPLALQNQDGATIDLATTNAIRLQIAAAAYTVNVAPDIGVDAAALHIAGGRTNNGQSQILLIGDTTYTNSNGGGLRLRRNGGGANSGSEIVSRGTGALTVGTAEAGTVGLQTNSVERIQLATNVYTTIFGPGVTTETVSLSIAGGRAGDGISQIAMASDTTYAGGSFNLSRAAGANGNSSLTHRGTGALRLLAQDAGTVDILSNSVLVARANAAGNSMTFPVGIDFGSTIAGSNTDLASHIALWGTTFGFNVTTAILNIVAGNAAVGSIAFVPGGTEQFRMTADGRLYGVALHNNAGAMTGVTNQYIGSGTYTPTLTNTTNVAASTPRLCNWTRVGNVVTVAGQFDVDPTGASANTVLGMSLPIASNFTTALQAGGAGSATGTAGEAWGVLSDSVNDRVTFNSFVANAANHTVSFCFQYEILA